MRYDSIHYSHCEDYGPCVRLNPQHAPQIDVHPVAVSDETGRAVVASELELHQVICNCADCCRGIVRAADTGWSQQVSIKYIFDK